MTIDRYDKGEGFSKMDNFMNASHDSEIQPASSDPQNLTSKFVSHQSATFKVPTPATPNFSKLQVAGTSLEQPPGEPPYSKYLPGDLISFLDNRITYQPRALSDIQRLNSYLQEVLVDFTQSLFERGEEMKGRIIKYYEEIQSYDDHLRGKARGFVDYAEDCISR